jgi:hypothetical protein
MRFDQHDLNVSPENTATAPDFARRSSARRPVAFSFLFDKRARADVPALQSHTIVAAPEAAKPLITISHCIYHLGVTSAERGSHAMVSDERFPTFEEASSFASEAAKAWVD